MERTTRRAILQRAGIAAVSMGTLLPDLRAGAEATAPTASVALARCATYELPALVERLGSLLDKVGGLRHLVAGKTVAVKVNLTGSPGNSALGLPAGRTYHTHPHMVQALAVLLDRAGARRVRFLEGTYSTQPFEKTLLAVGWDVAALRALKTKVEFEDTRNKGTSPSYREIRVPGGGDLYPAYLLNRSYVDCDVYISLAKLKNHATAGVTLSMKNNFGITPTALYSEGTENENSTNARVEVFHEGRVAPARGVPQELHHDSPRVPSYRVPRHTVDAVGIRPIDLAIIDGVETVSGGEGPWLTLAVQRPHLLVAGRNPVCTDSIATVCMGYDPQGARATGPYPGDNHLAMAAKRGIGTNDPKRIEVVGLSLAQARHPFGREPKERGT
jgi:uncharacterized protein (DUF362 family)